MPIQFGPQLIGEAEKTLNALLRRLLDGTQLTEAHWVTLRLASQIDPQDDTTSELVAKVSDRAHFDDAPDLVAELSGRGLIDGGRLTSDGCRLVDEVQSRISTETEPIWSDLPPDDVAAATRVLNEIVARARAVIGRAR